MGFELLRFALVSTTLCGWWTSAPCKRGRKHGVRKCGESRFVAGGDTCLINWLRALVVLGNELRVFLLVVNQVKSRAAAAAVVVPVMRGR